MKINILHLYPNLMNLYGEYANVTVLERHLSDQGFEVAVTKADSVQDVELSEFQFIYIGAGMERSQKHALADLMQKKEDFHTFSNSKKVILFTGSAYEFLGKTITDSDGKTYEALGIGAFSAVQQSAKRITTDCYASCAFLDKIVVGFINKCSDITENSEPIFNMKMGYGDNKDGKDEGFRKENTFGTYMTGPLLVKNPAMMQYVVECIGKVVNPDFEYKAVEYPYEQKAYEVTEQKLRERMESNG
ncbi:MAG: hypothetical protein ACI4M3_06260 [Acutalibacteraceae bacterium]